MSEEREAYAGICERCGALRAAAVDEPSHRKDVAAAVADMVKCGLRVERMTCEAVRAANWTCPDEHAPNGCPERPRKTRRRAEKSQLDLGAA